MSNTQENPTYRGHEKGEQSVDIKALIFIFLSKWYLFLACVIIALGGAWLYNHFSASQFRVSGTVFIKDTYSRFDPTSIMTGVNYGNMQNLDNEIAILQSYSLSEKVIKQMNLEVTYYNVGRIRTVEAYKTSPFTVEFNKEIPQAVGLTYYITINGDQVTLKADAKAHAQYDFTTEQFVVPYTEEDIHIEGVYKVGEWIDTGYNRFLISKNELYDPENDDNRKMAFVFLDYLTLTRLMRFAATTITKQASIVAISMIGPNTRKMVEFINTLMDEYVNRGLERKNQVSENTIKFIDEQLEQTASDLGRAEIDLEQFRSSHDLTNLNAQSTQIINTLQQLEKDHAELVVKMQYYKRLQSYMQENIDNPDNLAAPSAMGINDPLLNKLVQDLVNLNQQKALQQLAVTDEHPIIVKLDEQIVTTKRTILENINNLVENTQLSLNDVGARIRKIENESRNLPQKERMLVSYQRRFTLSQETYNYLMQRRAEAQIIKASNTADNEVIDYASVQRSVKVAPQTMVNYLIALVLGLLIPAIILFLIDFFNDKIGSPTGEFSLAEWLTLKIMTLVLTRCC